MSGAAEKAANAERGEVGRPAVQTLFDPPERSRGPVRRALERQIARLRREARETGRARTESETLVELCRALADGLDLARARRDPFAVTAVGRELRQALLDLEPKRPDVDELEGWLDGLLPSLGDTAQS